MKKIIPILFLVSLFAFSVEAQTSKQPAFFTNIVSGQLVTTGATSNILSAAIPVNPGFGVGLTVKEHNASTSATTNATVNINVTYDGTNWPSPATYSIQVPHAANTTNFWYTNMPAGWFDSAMAFRVESVTNNDAANSVTFDQVTVSRKRLDY